MSDRLAQGQDQRLAALDVAITRSVAQADAGLPYDLDEVVAELDAKYAAMESANAE